MGSLRRAAIGVAGLLAAGCGSNDAPDVVWSGTLSGVIIDNIACVSSPSPAQWSIMGEFGIAPHGDADFTGDGAVTAQWSATTVVVADYDNGCDARASTISLEAIGTSTRSADTVTLDFSRATTSGSIEPRSLTTPHGPPPIELTMAPPVGNFTLTGVVLGDTYSGTWTAGAPLGSGACFGLACDASGTFTLTRGSGRAIDASPPDDAAPSDAPGTPDAPLPLPPDAAPRDDCGRFDGTTSGVWEQLADAPLEQAGPGFTHFSGTGTGALFSIYNTFTARYDLPPGDAWDQSLASPPVDVGPWPGPAWVEDQLWLSSGSSFHYYTVSTDTWATVPSGFTGVTNGAQTTTDGGNLLFTLTDAREVAVFDVSTMSLVKTTALPAGSTPQTARLTYDACSERVYVAPRYDEGDLFEYDPVTDAVTPLTPHPEGWMNTNFCGDRSGHIYAAGGNAGTDYWQYDIDTDSWSRLADTPVNHASCGACTVTANNFLHWTGGCTVTAHYRMALGGP